MLVESGTGSSWAYSPEDVSLEVQAAIAEAARNQRAIQKDLILDFPTKPQCEINFYSMLRRMQPKSQLSAGNSSEEYAMAQSESER